MTVKEAMMRVGDDPAEFPAGWNTELKEVYRKNGGEFYERRQTRVWVLMRRILADADEIETRVFRSAESARTRMEGDIADYIRTNGGECELNAADLRRTGRDRAAFEGCVEWRVTSETLFL